MGWIHAGKTWVSDLGVVLDARLETYIGCHIIVPSGSFTDSAYPLTSVQCHPIPGPGDTHRKASIQAPCYPPLHNQFRTRTHSAKPPATRFPQTPPRSPEQTDFQRLDPEISCRTPRVGAPSRPILGQGYPTTPLRSPFAFANSCARTSGCDRGPERKNWVSEVGAKGGGGCWGG